MKRKICNHCKRILPIQDFYKDITQDDGKSRKCKDCCKWFVSQWKERNTEKCREYSKRSLERNRELINKRQRERDRKRREKKREEMRWKSGRSGIGKIEFYRLGDKVRKMRDAGMSYSDISYILSKRKGNGFTPSISDMSVYRWCIDNLI